MKHNNFAKEVVKGLIKGVVVAPIIVAGTFVTIGLIANGVNKIMDKIDETENLSNEQNIEA